MRIRYIVRVYQEGGDRVFLPVWCHIAMIWGPERRFLSNFRAYYLYVFDSTMPFPERKLALLEQQIERITSKKY